MSGDPAWTARDARLAAILVSIGDGVISTDREGRVEFMNAVAVGLTGWPEEEARGRPIGEVFRIINEETRQPAVNPIDRVLREGVVVGLANHTALIARDGTERPIADSGAPVRQGGGDVTGAVLVFRDVSEERRQEEALRQSEERFRLLIEGVQDYAIFLMGADGRVSTWNPGAERIKGYRAEEIIGRHYSTFFPPEDVASRKPERALETAAQLGRFEEEAWRVRRDGSRFWASVVLTSLRDQDGSLRGFAKITRDFTERKAAEENARQLLVERAARAVAEEAEQRLRASEEQARTQAEQLRIILGSVSEGISVQDLHGRLLYANDAAARSCGLASGEEMVRADSRALAERFETLDEEGQLIPADGLPGRQVLAGAGPRSMVMQVRERATGRSWWSEVSAAAVRDEAGQPFLAVNVWRDISEQRRRERQALFLSQASAIIASGLDLPHTLEQLARLAVPSMADWAVVQLLRDSELEVAAVAHADPARVELAREVTRRWPTQLEAERGAGAIARTGVSQLIPEIPEEMLVQSAQDQEHLRILRQLGLRSALGVPLIARGRPIGTLTMIWAESNRRYDEEDLAVAEELGRRAGAAVDNARLYQEAQQAIRVRDDFLTVAGHELRTPLTALALQIGSVSRMLASPLGERQVTKLRERFDKMAGHCGRIERLVADLLDVSRLTSGRLTLDREELDLGALVAEVSERFTEVAAHAGCAIEYAPARVVGQFDRMRAEQVVANLLTNAIKYGGGKPIQVQVAQRGGDAVLQVADSGIGIAPADQKRIFQRFERAVSDRNFGGLGLGLWIVREIVHAHGGSIEVASRPGEGARFQVVLPCVPPPAPTGPASSPGDQALAAGRPPR